MGKVPKSLLVLVTLILALCIVAGFAIGILPALKRGAVAEEEEAPVSSLAASSLGVKDAQPLSEPVPLPPKPKAAPEAAPPAASDTAPTVPVVKAAPLAVPPLETAPGAPIAPAPVAPKPAGDLPPT